MRLVFAFAAVTVSLAAAIPPDERFGRVLEPVPCEADPTQTYALYVPSYYASDRPWPVIFCFDAMARGTIPVERLQAAAEKYGYILAGSLKSRNGPWAANARAARAMIADVSTHFSIDPRRIYTVGMSGGARVATSLALAGTARGVIACGAGFPDPVAGPPAQVPFAFFSIVGTEDFNHGELHRLDDQLEDRRAVHRLVEFNGGHEWAPVASLTAAVEWLELQAMRAGVRPKAGDFIATQLQARLAAVPASVGADQWRALKSLAADFNGLADTNPFERQARELATHRRVKADLQAERALAGRESALLAELGETARESPRRQRALAAEIARLADQPADTAERRMVRRARAGFVAMAPETAHSLRERAQFEPAANFLEMADALRPNQPAILFDLARTYAAGGDRRSALATLERAAAAGFADAERATREPAFEALRDDSRFIKSLAAIRASAAGPTLALPPMRVSTALAAVELRPIYLPHPDTPDRPVSFLRVEGVGANTAAARAGIEPGMEVIAIQGIRMRRLAERDLEKIMTLPAGDEIILTVREPVGHGEREIHLVARPVAPTAR
ncbi:MAG TPA: hypothetical protein VG734_14410 [Lacunisphaera sp.]|nr:hypothetical protein [Lacunisphaera sp.]